MNERALHGVEKLSKKHRDLWSYFSGLVGRFSDFSEAANDLNALPTLTVAPSECESLEVSSVKVSYCGLALTLEFSVGLRGLPGATSMFQCEPCGILCGYMKSPTESGKRDEVLRFVWAATGQLLESPWQQIDSVPEVQYWINPSEGLDDVVLNCLYVMCKRALVPSV